MAEQASRSCILLELTDGTLRAYDYPDEQSAQKWHRECRQEWNEGRKLVFYLRQRARLRTSTDVLGADDVAHLELTTSAEARSRGAELQSAFIFG